MASRRPNVMACPCRFTRKWFEGVAGPPSRARRVSLTGVGGAVPRSWHWPCRTVPHSGGDGFSPRELAEQRRGVIPRRMMAQLCCVRALMPVPACGGGCAREGASSEAETNPPARRSPLEWGVDPQARRSLLEGALDRATPVGRGGHRGVGRDLRVRFKWEVFRFGSLQVLSRIPLVVLGDPQGCPDKW
jgi:hypothetical protein